MKPDLKVPKQVLYQDSKFKDVISVDIALDSRKHYIVKSGFYDFSSSDVFVKYTLPSGVSNEIRLPKVYSDLTWFTEENVTSCSNIKFYPAGNMKTFSGHYIITRLEL